MGRYEELLDAITSLAPVEGTTPLGVAMLPEPLNKVLQQLIRRGGMSTNELAETLETTPKQAQHLGEQLVAKGYLRTEEQADAGGMIFRVYLARMRKQNIPLDF